jgi:hypothetical protein
MKTLLVRSLFLLSHIVLGIVIIPNQRTRIDFYEGHVTQFSIVVPSLKRAFFTVRGPFVQKIILYENDGPYSVPFKFNGSILQSILEPSVVGRLIRFQGYTTKSQNVTFEALFHHIEPIHINDKDMTVVVEPQFVYYQYSNLCSEILNITLLSKEKFEIVHSFDRLPNQTEFNNSFIGYSIQITFKPANYYIIGLKSASEKCINGSLCDLITIRTSCFLQWSLTGFVLGISYSIFIYMFFGCITIAFFVIKYTSKVKDIPKQFY